MSDGFVIPAQAGTHGGGTTPTMRPATSVGPGLRRDDVDGKADPKTAKVAQQFEALFVRQLLKSARAASLADDALMGAGGETFRDYQDDARAQALAAVAPLGVAKLLAARTPTPAVNSAAPSPARRLEIKR